MKTLGVTGGIGSGKTEACRILETLGAQVFYADDEAKTIIQKHPEVRRDMILAFGPDTYDAEGRLNRAYVASRVFGSPERLALLNRIVHPRVYEAFEQRKQKAEESGLLVLEAALLFESGGDAYVDQVLVLEAPSEVRVQRVTRRDRTSPESVQARIAHQWPREERLRRADHVIYNTGSLSDLRREVETLFRELTSA